MVPDGDAQAERGPRAAALALAGLLLVGLGTSWIVEAATAPVARETVRVHDPWTETIELTYAPIPIDAPDARLPMDAPGYLTTLTPRFEITLRWRVDDPRAPVTQATSTLMLVAQGTRHGQPWRHAEELPGTMSPGADDWTLTTTALVDLPAVHERARGDDANLTSWQIEATFDGASSARGELVTTREFPFTFDPPLVVFPGAAARTHAIDHGQREVMHDSTPARLAGVREAPLGPAAVLGGLVAFGLAWRGLGKEDPA